MGIKRAWMVVTMLMVLVACGAPDKVTLLKKAEGADTKAKLEEALGRPADIGKLGPIERWTYKAKDGEVIFIITGNRVAVDFTGGGGAPAEGQ